MYIQNNNNNPKKNSEKKTYIDYNIFSGNIKLVGENGKVEIIDRDDAIEIAKSRGMNLVQISYSNNDYPKAICKIMDYGKFKFEQKKREKENARKSRIANAEAKEIDFSIRIDDGDYKHKVEQIRKFLVDDNLKVKITVKLSKRELSVKNMAVDLIKKILSNFDQVAILDGKPVDGGRFISCLLKPLKK